MIKKQADKFFKWYCHPDYYEDIHGDLEELFEEKLAVCSKNKAEWQYAKEVLLLFRPSIIRPISFLKESNLSDMLKNYLKLGFRNLKKQQTNSLIHIFGLAFGLAAFLLINQYTSFEKSYDTFHENGDQLYRLTTDYIKNGNIEIRDAMTFAPAGKALQAELPDVLSSTTTLKRRDLVFRKNGMPIKEENVIAADSNFLNLFTYEVLAGNRQEMLKEPYSLVLTKSKAYKYFGKEDPLGKTIEVLGNFDRPFKVTGLIEDIPANTHYHFDMLMSLKSRAAEVLADGWNGYNYYTYLKMNREADLAQIQPKLPQLARKFLDNEESNLAFNLQPIAEIHLNNEYTYEPEPNGNAQTIYFLDIISFFILLIAWINYINLSTAYATERAKEVGLRKVVGAKKGQLIGQFFTESFLINLMGALTALFIIQLSLPYFNNLVGKTILIDVWSQPDLFTKLGIFCLIGTFITGVYPAFIMASFKPIGVLKGTFSRSKSGVNLRKGLVIFQFAASLVLIAATMTVYQQIEFLVNKNLGIEVDQVIGLNNNASWEGMRGEAFKSKYNAFYGEISESKSVKKAGTIAYLPGGNNTNMSSTSSGFKVLGLSEYIDAIAYFNQIDDHILEVLGIQLLSGRNFNRDITTDSTAVLINESMLKLIGLSDPNKILNQRLRFGKNETNRQYSIVGVIKDFNHNSLKSAVKPTVYQFRKTGRNTLIKLSSTDFKSQLAELELVWERFFPNAPFEYTFLDKRFEQLYNDDKKFGAIFAVFAILAIFIAILGLFGLASYITIQRTKEVGVRKVLGASTQQIILLIFKDFFWLILVAIFAGIPFIYWSMNGWLEGYAYRIDFPWWLLGVSMLIILILAFCTVSMQTYKIATLNPSKTIRQGG